MEQQVFLCPLCNAPHDEKLQPGTLQVKCKYCGGVIIVPSRLTGLYEWCPDHPDFLSVGLCAQCGRNCCDVCLHVLERFGVPTRYLCSKCTKVVLHRESLRRRLWVPVSLLVVLPLSILGSAVQMRGTMDAGAAVIASLIVITMVLGCAAVERASSSSVVPTLREKKEEQKGHFGEV